jgi:hypothetical protein
VDGTPTDDMEFGGAEYVHAEFTLTPGLDIMHCIRWAFEGGAAEVSDAEIWPHAGIGVAPSDWIGSI